MPDKRIIVLLFIVMAIVQWYVPARMIFGHEMIIRGGEPFKFKIAPIDPLDPFRGKYVLLEFKDVAVSVADPGAWKNNEAIYVSLAKDANGYAMIEAVSKTKPDSSHFLEANVGFTGSSSEQRIFVKYPFDRFYMEETKAAGAELLYREAARDPGQVAYAMVFVKDGKAALTDVYINDISIQRIVEEHNQKMDR